MTVVNDLTQRIALQPGAVSIPAWWPRRARSALMAAMAVNAADRGFAGSRVQEIVELAHASRRTFYTHFANREQCLLETHAAVVDDVLLATQGHGPDVALDRLMRYLAAWPAHAQLLVVEVLAVGSAGRMRHEDAMARLARRVADCAPPPERAAGPRGEALAQARFGSLHRLVQQRIIAGQCAALPRLTPILAELATAPART